MQIHKVAFEVLLVLPPCHAVHSGGRIPLKPEIGRPQQIHIDMV
jgi:hypothetical protein